MFEMIGAIPVLGPVLTVLLPFVLVLGVVVAVHEYGHYIVGRWSGIHAEVFSLGFGPVIWKRPDRYGTVWQVAAVPLGGYVKFLGDADGSSRTDHDAVEEMDAQTLARSFPGATVGRRMATVLAGPVFNFMLSIVIFAGLAVYTGKAPERPTVGELNIEMVDGQDLRAGDVIVMAQGQPVENGGDLSDIIREMSPKGPMELRVERDGREVDILSPYLLPPLVGSVFPLQPAQYAGVQEGDLFLSVDGQELDSFEALREIVLASEAKELAILTLRDGEEITLKITPKITDAPKDAEEGGGFEKKVMIGVAGQFAFDSAVVPMGPFEVVWAGVKRVWFIISSSVSGLYHMVFGELSASNLQGPLGIAQVSGTMATQGWIDLINWIGVISTAIGFLNLLPIPVLDGGHLVVFGYEAVTGKTPPERILEVAMAIGLSLLLMLMMFATYNDLWRWFTAP